MYQARYEFDQKKFLLSIQIIVINSIGIGWFPQFFLQQHSMQPETTKAD